MVLRVMDGKVVCTPQPYSIRSADSLTATHHKTSSFVEGSCRVCGGGKQLDSNFASLRLRSVPVGASGPMSGMMQQLFPGAPIHSYNGHWLHYRLPSSTPAVLHLPSPSISLPHLLFSLSFLRSDRVPYLLLTSSHSLSVLASLPAPISLIKLQ
ncbi:hypothetical protein XENOCAPTIV_029027 [Xenoophorus captivus]|uniref:Uncharacterized protein n=1 Tax=Xenoophorus captivus TaxID=1517983 RepID=A0ABV0QV93_9TELE